MKQNACQMPNSFLCIQRDLEKDNGHSLVLVLKRSGTPLVKTVHKRMGPYGGKDVSGISRKQLSNFSCYKSIVQSNGHGKLSIHCAADLETIETIFRITVSANQLSLYGAVTEMCEEYETLHDRSRQPVVGGESETSKGTPKLGPYWKLQLVACMVSTESRLEFGL